MHPECNNVANHRLKNDSIIILTQLLMTMTSYLHDKSLEADSFKVVGVFAIEFEVVVENEAVLHVTRHFKPDRRSTCKCTQRFCVI